MKRTFGILIVVVPVLLGLIIGAVWMRSIWIEDYWYCQSRWAWTVMSRSGKVHVLINYKEYQPMSHRHSIRVREPVVDEFQPTPHPGLVLMGWSTTDFFFHHLGLVIASGDAGGKMSGKFHLFVVPYWLPLLLSLALPGFRVMELTRRRRRIVRDLCGRCGYDVRACEGRCSECGEPLHRKGVEQTAK